MVRKSSVLVLHPFLQHSHQLAMGLFERDLLMLLWTGTPLLGLGELPSSLLPRQLSARMKRTTIPKAKLRLSVWPQLAIRATGLFPLGNPSDNSHRIFHAFDYIASKQLSILRPDVVVAFENSAFNTFTAAKRLGIRCVLDAPSLHHIPSDALIDTPQTKLRNEINRRKDAEVELAEMILTCSSLAANSYIENGVSKTKMFPMLLGAEIPQQNDRTNTVSVRGKPKFVFAGGLTHRKSIDLILAAFRTLHSEGFQFQIIFVGGCSNPGYLEEMRHLPGTEHHPPMPQENLFEIFRNSDCLLLPSRFDSFGMVVAEAMACGIPAVVSTRTGAKEIVEKHPNSGWVVEPSIESLTEQLRYLLINPDKLHSAKSAALDASKEFTWAAYRMRIGSLFESLCA